MLCRKRMVSCSSPGECKGRVGQRTFGNDVFPNAGAEYSFPVCESGIGCFAGAFELDLVARSGGRICGLE